VRLPRGFRKIRRKKKDGTVRIYIQARAYKHDLDGKRKRMSVYGHTVDDVRAKLRKLEDRCITSFRLQKIGFEVYIETWLARLETSSAPRTHELYTGIVAKHIKPYLGAMQLMQITRTDIRNLLEQTLKHVGSRTRQLAYRILHHALEDAVDRGLISTNPCSPKDKPKHVYREFRSLTKEEAQRLLAVAKETEFHLLLYLALATGMRQGELFALRWDSVNTDAGFLSVIGTLSKDGAGQLCIRPPKGKGKSRRIDLSSSVVEMLQEHKRCQCPITSWVFPNVNGSPMQKDNFMHRVFRPLIKQAGLGNLRFHDLRHTSATLGLAAGENIKIVQERLGHASAKMTLDVYAKAVPTLQREAATRMDSILTTDGATNGATSECEPVPESRKAI
jgi:integrase